MTPFDLHFLRPLWLLALLPLGLLLWRLVRSHGDADAWRGVVDAHLLPRLLTDDAGGKRHLPLWLLGLGWLLLVLAVAGPTWERLPEPLYQARQYRVIVLDLSPSMNAADLAPSRLARARFEVLDLLRQSAEGQTALLAYGAEPYVVAPLTTDVETIAAQVPHLDTGLLPVPGARRTDLALDQAGELLRQAEAPDGQVILVTDGLNRADAAGAAARRLHAAGYTVSVLGMGTTGGAPVEAPDGGFLKDDKGAIRLPRLDVAALRNLADAGGGVYVTAAADDRDIQTLRSDAPTAAGEQAGDQRAGADRWREEGPWLLLLLLPLAALAFRRGWLSPLLLVVCILPAPDAHALSWGELWLRPDQQATRLLEQGHSDQAAQLFERPDWRAAAQYAASDYEQALQSLQDLDDADTDYNRGNVLARLGRLEEALDAYERALARAPDDQDARHNRDLVQRLLEQGRQAAEQADESERADEQSEQAQSGDQGSEDGQQQQQAGEQAAAGEQQQAGDQGIEGEQQQQAGDQAAEAGQDQQQADAQQAEGGQDQQQSSSAQDAGSEQQGSQQAQAQGSDAAQAQSGGQAAGSEQAGSQQARAQGAAAGQEGQQASAEQDPGGAQRQRQQADAQGPQGEHEAQQQGAGQDAENGQQGAPPQITANGHDGDQEQPQSAPAQVGGAQQDQAQQQAPNDAQPGPADGQGGAAEQHTAAGPSRAQPGSDSAMPRAAMDAPDAQAPGLADLLGDRPQVTQGTQVAAGSPGLDAEDRQAVEQMLRRVEDDPAGLLRQRFLLQHLRRSGRLP